MALSQAALSLSKFIELFLAVIQYRELCWFCHNRSKFAAERGGVIPPSIPIGYHLGNPISSLLLHELQYSLREGGNQRKSFCLEASHF